MVAKYIHRYSYQKREGMKVPRDKDKKWLPLALPDEKIADQYLVNTQDSQVKITQDAK